MSSKQELIDRLNDALAWELAGIIQYMQAAVMATGEGREIYYDFFHESSEEAHEHAELVGDKIAALGGVPTVEPATIRQAADVEGMLENALLLERDALEAWEAAHAVADAANPGTVFWIEEHIAEEQEHVDHLEKVTGKINFSSSDIDQATDQSG